MSLVEKSLAIALDAYKGQVDKAGQPYILHPLRLMAKMETEAEQVVALLHDVVEDSDYTPEDLVEAGIPERLVEAVLQLTKNEGESYEHFVQRASSNDLARKVKIADIEDNINVLRLNTLEDKDLSRVAKYHRAWKMLVNK